MNHNGLGMESNFTDLKNRTMEITNEQIKELKNLLWILDSKHNVSVPQTQENINYIADEIVKLFSIPVVVQQSEQLKCDNCMSNPTVIYRTPSGRFCGACRPNKENEL